MLCCVLLGLADGEFYPYPSGLLHRCWGNIIAPVPVKPPWRIWVNILHESSKNGDITTTKQSTINTMYILWDVLNNPCWLLLLHVNTSQIQDGQGIIMNNFRIIYWTNNTAVLGESLLKPSSLQFYWLWISIGLDKNYVVLYPAGLTLIMSCFLRWNRNVAIWWNCHHLLCQNLAFWQLLVQLVTKIL